MLLPIQFLRYVFGIVYLLSRVTNNLNSRHKCDLYFIPGPLSSILSVKYSYRTVTLIGGAFAAIGMIISFWASSLTYLYIR